MIYDVSFVAQMVMPGEDARLTVTLITDMAIEVSPYERL